MLPRPRRPIPADAPREVLTLARSSRLSVMHAVIVTPTARGPAAHPSLARIFRFIDARYVEPKPGLLQAGTLAERPS
jgi:hypothetical protein